jgi:hypothetical protein
VVVIAVIGLVMMMSGGSNRNGGGTNSRGSSAGNGGGNLRIEPVNRSTNAGRNTSRNTSRNNANRNNTSRNNTSRNNTSRNNAGRNNAANGNTDLPPTNNRPPANNGGGGQNNNPPADEDEAFQNAPGLSSFERAIRKQWIERKNQADNMLDDARYGDAVRALRTFVRDMEGKIGADASVDRADDMRKSAERQALGDWRANYAEKVNSTPMGERQGKWRGELTRRFVGIERIEKEAADLGVTLGTD